MHKQVVAPVVDAELAGQAVQGVEPDAENVLGEHDVGLAAVHTSVEPMPEDVKPESQEQVVAPVVDAELAGQAVQGVDPVAEYLFAGHDVADAAVHTSDEPVPLAV